MGPPVELAVLNALQAGKREPYVLPGWALPPLRHAVSYALASSEGSHERRRLWALADTIESQMGSPGAASALRDLIEGASSV